MPILNLSFAPYHFSKRFLTESKLFFPSHNRRSLWIYLETGSFFMAKAKVGINILKIKGLTTILGLRMSYFRVPQFICSSGFSV